MATPYPLCACCHMSFSNIGFDLCTCCFNSWTASGRKRCASCKSAPPNKGKDLCELCYQHWKAYVISSTKTAVPDPAFARKAGYTPRPCSRCGKPEVQPRRDLCTKCYTQWKVNPTNCARCQATPPNPGRDLCEACYKAWMGGMERPMHAKECISVGPDIEGEIPRVDVSSLWTEVTVCDEKLGSYRQFLGIHFPEKMKKDSCAICMDEMETGAVVTLVKCSHMFHKDCITGCVQRGSLKCPVCTCISGTSTGTQPQGTMEISSQRASLPGYPDTSTWHIIYSFPDGIQQVCHPQPGQPYHGTRREAFLPSTPAGNLVLDLLKESFRRRLTFTIGTSTTTGVDNCVIWNGVHHKTVPHGGPENHGYPDPTYLDRVKEELAALGVFAQKEVPLLPAPKLSDMDSPSHMHVDSSVGGAPMFPAVTPDLMTAPPALVPSAPLAPAPASEPDLPPFSATFSATPITSVFAPMTEPVLAPTLTFGNSPVVPVTISYVPTLPSAPPLLIPDTTTPP